MTTAGEPRSFVAAEDVAVAPVGQERLTVSTGTRTVTIAVDPDSAGTLMRVLTEIVPQLRRSQSFTEDLSPDQRRQIEPYLEDLLGIGVLLDAPPHITTDAERGLLTFLARRTADAKAAYLRAQEQHFQLIGPDEVVGRWAAAFDAQGLRLTPAGSDRADGAGRCTVIELIVDPGTLRERAAAHHAQGSSWVPVVLEPSRARLGPWTLPGETACPVCPATLHAQEASPPRHGTGASASWLSRQPGAQEWIGGLLAHSALRIVAPAGPHGPWGQRFDLDLLRTEQTATTVWKDPFCPVCGPEPHPHRQWIEA